MRLKVNDVFGIHSGYMLDLKPGYTPLVGPNGAGKTTLLHQLRDYAKEHGCLVFEYSNLADGGNVAREAYLFKGEAALLAASAFSSEGEQVALNFGQAIRKLGAAVREAKEQGKPLFILLDALDSGASIDRARELREFFDMVCRDAGETAYIVCACNSYELVRGVAGINVRTGKRVRFKDYEEYANFICTFLEKFSSSKQKPEDEERGERSLQSSQASTPSRKSRSRVFVSRR